MFIKKRISIVSKTTLLLLVFVFSFVNLAPLALAAPADATTEAECQTENGFWDGTTCTDPTATADDNNSCEESAGDFSFILCPTLYALDAAIGALDGIVTGLLTIDFDRLEYSDGLKNAWGAVRNLAYVILIPMLLLMVIGTALGFKFLDAYTVKRALPRLFVAVIFIALSWDFCRILINMSNDVG